VDTIGFQLGSGRNGAGYQPSGIRCVAPIGDAHGSCLSQALDHIQKTKESWSESELHRTAGELALEADRNMADAEAHFHRSLAIAREQNARSLELRAAMSLARLWRDQGERDRPRELLAPIYNWFTEGFDTPDLKEARTLLTELG